MIGSNVIPFQSGGGMLPPAPPPMMLNPALQQWMQLKQAWDAETQRRQQQFEAACALIREDAGKSYKIDIEADSTVAADEEAEKAARTEFLRAIVPLMEVLMGPQIPPAMLPLAAEMIKFAFHAFPSSRQLEDALDSALQKMAQMPPQQPQEGKGKTVAETQMETQVEGAKVAASVHDTQVKAQMAQQESAARLMAAQIEATADREKAQAEMQLRQAELGLKGREIVGREAIEQARLQHFASRDTKGLV